MCTFKRNSFCKLQLSKVIRRVVTLIFWAPKKIKTHHIRGYITYNALREDFLVLFSKNIGQDIILLQYQGPPLLSSEFSKTQFFLTHFILNSTKKSSCNQFLFSVSFLVLIFLGAQKLVLQHFLALLTTFAYKLNYTSKYLCLAV